MFECICNGFEELSFFQVVINRRWVQRKNLGFFRNYLVEAFLGQHRLLIAGRQVQMEDLFLPLTSYQIQTVFNIIKHFIKYIFEGSSPAATKPLRYLSPTAIESSFSRVPTRTVESISDTAVCFFSFKKNVYWLRVIYLFVFLQRKRPLESPQATGGVANGSFYISDTAKRFRGTAANTSLISEPVSH